MILHRIRIWRLILLLFLVWMSVMLLIQGQTGSAQGYKKAVLIPVDQGIERGLEAFLHRAFTFADEQGADLVILAIDTPGGEIAAASNIGKLVREAPQHVVAFIDNQAFSAGTYIALNADEIVMTPGSSIGAATPIELSGNAAGVKLISAWSEKMVAAAKLNNRDPQIARAMVEIDKEFTGIKPKGTVLSLEAKRAKEVGYADQVVANESELYQYLGVKEAEVISVEQTAGEKVARFVTDPVVLSALLVIGFVGITMELLSPGFGVPGIVGLSAFTLYFFGHYVAGFASWLHIAMFVMGVILILAELVVPGGIVGGIGFISMVSGLVLAAYDTKQGLTSLGLAALITAIVAFVMIKYFGMRGGWHKFILSDDQRNEKGYVAPKNQQSLLGKEGTSITALRPAGVVEIEGQRVDAVSNGSFILAKTSVQVVQVDGARVVVEEKTEQVKE